MTPDLNQSLSLKAALNDQVTPTLKKIERHTRTTSEVLQQFVDKSARAGETVGSSTGAMAQKVAGDLGQVQKNLKETGGAFQEFGGEAQGNATKVGQALENALYTKGASSRLSELEKDLSGLDQTFAGMASRARPMSARGRALQATSRDNINKKIIPAFQELHGTLDKYPDTLKDINALEENRMKMLDDGGKALQRVHDRMAGFNQAVSDIKFGVQDAVGLVTGGMLGAVGLNAQEQQMSSARLAGVEAFQQTPGQLEATTQMARTTMDEIQPFMEAIREMRSVAPEVFPEIVSGMVEIEKATGMAKGEIVSLQDTMVRLGGIKLPDYEGVMDSMAYLAQTSVASHDEMQGSLARATNSMLAFTESQRKNFLQQSMAAAAASRDMGGTADDAESLRQNALHSDDVYARLAGLMRNAGVTTPIDTLLKNPAQLRDAMTQLAQAYGPTMDLSTRNGVRQFEAIFGNIMTEEAFLASYRGKDTTAEGTGGNAMDRFHKAQKEGVGTIARTAAAVRGTVPEQMEQALGMFQSGMIEPGIKLVEGFGKVVDKFNDFLDRGVSLFKRMDDRFGGKLSTGIAAGVGAQAGWSLLRGGMKGFTGLTGMKVPILSKLLEGANPVEGVANLLGGGGLGKGLLKGGGLLGAGYLAKQGYDKFFGEGRTPDVSTEQLATMVSTQKKQIESMKKALATMDSTSKEARIHRAIIQNKEALTASMASGLPQAATPSGALVEMGKFAVNPFAQMKAAIKGFVGFLKAQAKGIAATFEAMKMMVKIHVQQVKDMVTITKFVWNVQQNTTDKFVEGITNTFKKVGETIDKIFYAIRDKLAGVLKKFGIDFAPKARAEGGEEKKPNRVMNFFRRISEARQNLMSSMDTYNENASERRRVRNLTPEEAYAETLRNGAAPITGPDVTGVGAGATIAMDTTETVKNQKPIAWRGMSRGETMMYDLQQSRLQDVPKPDDKTNKAEKAEEQRSRQITLQEMHLETMKKIEQHLTLRNDQPIYPRRTDGEERGRAYMDAYGR